MSEPICKCPEMDKKTHCAFKVYTNICYRNNATGGSHCWYNVTCVLTQLLSSGTTTMGSKSKTHSFLDRFFFIGKHTHTHTHPCGEDDSQAKRPAWKTFLPPEAAKDPPICWAACRLSSVVQVPSLCELSPMPGWTLAIRVILGWSVLIHMGSFLFLNSDSCREPQ